MPLLHGQVVAAYSRQYLVELPGGELLACLTRGKKSAVACGDFVELRRTSDSQAVIEKIAPRRTLLYRSDAFREKLIAANVSQAVIVVAAEPSFDDELLSRCLVAAHDQQLETLILLNKCDLEMRAGQARARLAPYRDIGHRVVEISAKSDASPLLPLLQNHTSVLVGQSGMGKSTLINALVPEARAATREISAALDSGKHTTTHARLHHLDSRSHLIDCPGLQVFGLHHLDSGAIESGFVEFAAYRGQCRFRNCRHRCEPGCALIEAVKEGKISARRLELFQILAG
jgi:ribosome biogenesis GTPase